MNAVIRICGGRWATTRCIPARRWGVVPIRTQSGSRSAIDVGQEIMREPLPVVRLPLGVMGHPGLGVIALSCVTDTALWPD